MSSSILMSLLYAHASPQNDKRLAIVTWKEPIAFVQKGLAALLASLFHPTYLVILFTLFPSFIAHRMSDKPSATPESK